MVLGDQVMGFITSDPEMQKSLNLDELRWKSGMKVWNLQIRKVTTTPPSTSLLRSGV